MAKDFDAPFFVAAPEDDPSGVDYLELRTINLAWMGELLPGINNVVSHVRIYSLMCWVAWKFGEYVGSGNRKAGVDEPEVDVQTFKRFREKVEALFVWCHAEEGRASGLVGNRQTHQNSAQLTFTFEAVHRKATLINPANYGASLKYPRGLGFLYSKKELFRPKEAGVALAQALDGRLRTRLTERQYEFLGSASSVRFPRDQMKGFFRALDVNRPSPAEQEIFGAVFFPEENVGAATASGNRATMLLVMTEYLRKARRPLSVSELRKAIACRPPTPALRAVHGSKALHARKLWQLLQVRQAQRLGLEALFSWVEHCLFITNTHSIPKLVEQTMDALKAQNKNRALPNNWVAQSLAYYREGGSSADALFQAGIGDSHRDIFQTMTEVEEFAAKPDTRCEVPFLAIRLLVHCTVFAQAFQQEPFSASRVNTGLKSRVPLGAWQRFVEGCEKMSPPQFVRKVFETFVVAQHMATAVKRTKDEKTKMRFSIEDEGLVSLLPSADKVLRPVASDDRLATALTLLASCGRIVELEGGKYAISV